MKKKNKVDAVYSGAVSAIVKHFGAPSLLVYFLSKTADLIYELDIKSGVPGHMGNTHSITLNFLRDVGEPWMNKDMWDVAINVRSLHKSLGYKAFREWVTEVIFIHSKADMEGLSEGTNLQDFMEYFAGLYAVSDAFGRIDDLAAIESLKKTA